MASLARLLTESGLYHGWRRLRERRRYRDWIAGGRLGQPPHLAKQAALRAVQQHHRLPSLVETGTYLGDMVHAMRRDFDHIYSIELSPELHARAARRFAGDSRITLLQGDSGQVLGSLVPQLGRGALFWLDGHYSGGVTAKGADSTPILAEIAHVLAAPGPCVVLIDDARLFTGVDGYPTVEALGAMVRAQRPSWAVTISDDIIHLAPPEPGTVATSVAPARAS